MADSVKGTLILKPTQIVITWPDGRRQVVPMHSESVRIGRGGENNDIAVPLEYTSISRRHMEIRREDKSYRLVDLGSSNGVYIHGQKVENVILQDGDEIRIGESNNQQEIQILFQMGTELLTSTEGAEQPTMPPALSLSSVVPENVPYLSVRFPNGQVSYFPVQKQRTVIGRSTEAELSIPYRFISTSHFELRQTGSEFTIMDLKSTNGTLLNNKPLVPNEPVPIHNNDIIRIGDESLGNTIGLTFFNPFEMQAPEAGFVMASPTRMLRQSKPVIIGRAPEADIYLDT
ncbi:MAG TPA: FHA domain-containing protein, partial [Anaerolineales bacterium]|nr:FHA domain-containing protein [Anaerolineales bacterium]